MTQAHLQSAVSELVELTIAGNWELAYEKFYHADLAKTDLDGVEVQGKDANIQNGHEFVRKITNVRKFASSGWVIEGERSFVTWQFDFDVEGQPFQVSEVAIQDWKEGRIIRERFFA